MIKDIIDYERKRRGLTIEEISAYAHIPMSTFKQRLANENNWRWGEIIEVAKVLRMRPEDIVTSRLERKGK